MSGEQALARKLAGRLPAKTGESPVPPDYFWEGRGALKLVSCSTCRTSQPTQTTARPTANRNAAKRNQGQRYFGWGGGRVSIGKNMTQVEGSMKDEL